MIFVADRGTTLPDDGLGVRYWPPTLNRFSSMNLPLVLAAGAVQISGSFRDVDG